MERVAAIVWNRKMGVGNTVDQEFMLYSGDVICVPYIGPYQDHAVWPVFSSWPASAFPCFRTRGHDPRSIMLGKRLQIRRLACISVSVQSGQHDSSHGR